MRKRGLAVFVLLSLLVTLAACGGGTKPAPSSGGQTTSGSTGQSGSSSGSTTPAPAANTPKKGGTLRFGILRDPAGFDPHIAYGISNHAVQGNIYDMLIEYDEKGQFRGALAEKWEASPDGLTFTFKLRKGIKFHDGTDFDADDVIATLKRIGDPATKAARKPTVDTMASYEAVDKNTVKIVLKKADSTFLHALASSWMYIVSADDVGKLKFVNAANGTGPFKLKSYDPQAKTVLVRNDAYWKPGMPYIDELVQIQLQDDKARVNALRSGEVDLIEYVPWQEMDGLNRDFSVLRHESLFNLVRFNSSVAPLDNKFLRQALNYVVDRQEVLNLAFGGQGRIITGPLQPFGSPYYFKELENTYTKDHAKATELLKKAGYNSPADVPALELTVASIAVHSETAQVVQQQLQKFGIKVTWKTVEVATMTANRTAGTYVMQVDGLSMAWPDPDYLRPYYHSKGTSHATGAKFKNEQLDKLLEDGVATLDETKRKQLYLQAEKIILDEAPWLFLLWRPQAEAIAKKVQGYVALPAGLGSFNENRFEYVWIDDSKK